MKTTKILMTTLLMCLISGASMAQKTTRVKSYRKKNGTVVRSHTRTYKKLHSIEAIPEARTYRWKNERFIN